jgi:hypothetical protein
MATMASFYAFCSSFSTTSDCSYVSFEKPLWLGMLVGQGTGLSGAAVTAIALARAREPMLQVHAKQAPCHGLADHGQHRGGCTTTTTVVVKHMNNAA